MLAVCKYLNEKKAYKILLEFLKFMKDDVRCGLTCIKLFLHAFNHMQDASLQLRYLDSAKAHFMEGLAAMSNGQRGSYPVQSPSSSSILTEAEITRYIKTVTLQIQVTKYTHSITEQSKPAISLLSSPTKDPNNNSATNTAPISFTLFGPTNQKAALAETMLVLHNFDLAFQIMQDFRLPITTIYVSAIKKIAQKKQEAKINDLLRNIKGTITDQEWDEILLAAINVFANEQQDYKTAEKFAVKLCDDNSRITALVWCKRLKRAYLEAVKMNNVEKVELIRDEAAKMDAKTEYEMCIKWLNQFSPVSRTNL